MCVDLQCLPPVKEDLDLEGHLAFHSGWGGDDDLKVSYSCALMPK